MHLFAEGFFLQASLILALGAQNLFVIESGLRHRRHLLVAFVSSACDALLIGLGVAGAATIFVTVPALKIGFGVLGVGFLFYYGVRKLIEGARATSVTTVENVETASSASRVIALSLGFSLLNPHVYLDTVILIGGYSARYAELPRRLEFGAGAAAFSIAWFFALATFAAAARSVLGRPSAMRVVSIVSGLILIALSIKLGREIWGWLA